jgi:hypothetical protein
MKTQEALRFAIESLVIYYENYPAITSVLQFLESMRYDGDLKDKAEEILTTRTHFLKNLIKEGITKGEIRADVDAQLFADMITGTSKEICLRWRMERYSFSLREQVMSALNIILDSLDSR